MANWFLTRDDKKYGPYPVVQMKTMASAGQLLPSDMVLEEGKTQWVAASQVQEFFPASGSAPPPPPLPPPAVPEPAEWHYTKSGAQAGPVPWSQLRHLAASGQLLPSDMLWKSGMPAWAAASTIPNLFPPPSAAPPPLPPGLPPASVPAVLNRVSGELAFQGEGGMAVGADQVDILLDGHKIGVGSVKGGFGVSFETEAGQHNVTLVMCDGMKKLFGAGNPQQQFPLNLQKPGHYTVTFSYVQPKSFVERMMAKNPAGKGLPTQTEITYSAQVKQLPRAVQVDPDAKPAEQEEALVPKMLRERREAAVVKQEEARRAKIHGLWEPVSGAGLSFMFTKDQAMLRGDGFATKFRWVAEDKLELYADDTDKTVQFTVLSLGEFELILKTGEQSGHFKKGVTITEAELKRKSDEARQRAKEAAANFKNVAMGAASVLAAGGFAVLCGGVAVAAVAAAASGPGRCCCRIPFRNGYVCANCGLPL